MGNLLWASRQDTLEEIELEGVTVQGRSSRSHSVTSQESSFVSMSNQQSESHRTEDTSTESLVIALTDENEKLKTENQYLKSLLQKERFTYDGKFFVQDFHKLKTTNTESCIKIDDEVKADEVYYNFYKYFEKVQRLPRQLQMDRARLWPVCCRIFMTSFKCCRDDFIDKLVKPLYSLTELSEEENENSKVDWARADQLKHVKIAYEHLLKYSLSKMKVVDRALVEKVMADASIDSDLLLQVNDQFLEAIKICWKMQMLYTPMFVCQPKVYNDKWHDIYPKTWQDRNNDLVYYRPVLMNSAGGSIRYKGYVGNSSTASGASGSTPIASAKQNSLTCSQCLQDIENLPTAYIEIDGKYYHKTSCIHTCNGCNDPVLVDEARWVSGAYWHLCCLQYQCHNCGNSINPQQSLFRVMHGPFYYHKDCYVCHICHKMTENLDLKQKFLYCKNCYETCSNCDTHIKRDGYIGPASGMIYCKKCRELKLKKKCLKCHEKIQEETSANKKFKSHDDTVLHVKCVQCEVCNQTVYPETEHRYFKFKYYHTTCKSTVS